MGGKKGGKGQGGQGGQGGKKPEPEKESQIQVSGKDRPVIDFANDPHFVSMIQNKMNSLIGQSSGYLESLPVQVQNRVKALKHLHSQKVEMDREFRKEYKALQEKYDKMFAPLYLRRTEIVQGQSEPKPEELVEVKKEEKDEKEEKKEEKKEVKKEAKEEKEEKPVKGVPDFWLEAFKHHGDFSEMITKKDEKILSHLINVRIIPADKHPDPSFAIEFEFEDNEFFTNKTITKSYILSENETLGETMFEDVESTEIKWKPGKNVTVRLVQQQVKGGGRGRGKGGRGKPQTKMVEERVNSFFNFFSKDGLLITEVDDDEEVDPAEMLEIDYEFGLAIKEQIIPSAVMWFTGEAAQEAGFGDGEDFGEDYESGEDGEFQPPQLEGPPGAVAAAGGEKPECAQQ